MEEQLRDPYYIQRCQVTEEDLLYDFMGDAHYECGARSESLKRIFEKDILVIKKFSLSIEGGNVDFFLVAGKGFKFSEYAPLLVELANEDYHDPEPTNLKWVIQQRLGGVAKKRYWGTVEELNAWFDIENDVLFVLSQKECEMLVSVLEGIKKMEKRE